MAGYKRFLAAIAATATVITGYHGGLVRDPGYAITVGCAALAFLTLGAVLLAWWRRPHA